MRTLRGGAGPLTVELHGRGGVPMMLVHGMAVDAAAWSAVIPRLAAGRLVVVPELRGHGRSALPPDGDHSIASNARDLLGVADQLGLDRFVLVGHSFGASVAIEMAAMAPGRVSSLIVVDGAGDFSHVPPGALGGFVAGLENDDEYVATVEGAFEIALAGARPATERAVRAALLAAPRPMVRAIYDALLSYHPTAALDRYPGPVLLVTAPANAASFALHALRPLLPRHSMPGVSHWVMMDEPDAFVDAVEEFLTDSGDR